MTETLTLATKFEADELDEGLDVNALPVPPWQLKELGSKLFKQLAAVMGAGESLNKNPSLNPRTFGVGRANRQIYALGLEREIAPTATGPEKDFLPEDYTRADEANVERVREIERRKAEGQRLQDAINDLLPPLEGTARNPNAKPLTPAKTTLKERGRDPGFIRR